MSLRAELPHDISERELRALTRRPVPELDAALGRTPPDDDDEGHADELGVVMRFGKFVRQEPPGLHFRLPYPIEEVRLPKVTRQNIIEVGMRSGCPGSRLTVVAPAYSAIAASTGIGFAGTSIV